MKHCDSELLLGMAHFTGEICFKSFFHFKRLYRRFDFENPITRILSQCKTPICIYDSKYPGNYTFELTVTGVTGATDAAVVMVIVPDTDPGKQACDLFVPGSFDSCYPIYYMIHIFKHFLTNVDNRIRMPGD